MVYVDGLFFCCGVGVSCWRAAVLAQLWAVCVCWLWYVSFVCCLRLLLVRVTSLFYHIHRVSTHCIVLWLSAVVAYSCHGIAFWLAFCWNERLFAAKAIHVLILGSSCSTNIPVHFSDFWGIVFARFRTIGTCVFYLLMTSTLWGSFCWIFRSIGNIWAVMFVWR